MNPTFSVSCLSKVKTSKTLVCGDDTSPCINIVFASSTRLRMHLSLRIKCVPKTQHNIHNRYSVFGKTDEWILKRFLESTNDYKNNKCFLQRNKPNSAFKNSIECIGIIETSRFIDRCFPLSHMGTHEEITKQYKSTMLSLYRWMYKAFFACILSCVSA